MKVWWLSAVSVPSLFCSMCVFACREQFSFLSIILMRMQRCGFQLCAFFFLFCLCPDLYTFGISFTSIIFALLFLLFHAFHVLVLFFMSSFSFSFFLCVSIPPAHPPTLPPSPLPLTPPPRLHRYETDRRVDRDQINAMVAKNETDRKFDTNRVAHALTHFEHERVVDAQVFDCHIE
jgi:hypothetical protein